MVVEQDDDDLVFNAGAFSVVSAWMLGGKSVAALVDEESGADTASSSYSHRAPVALYRPSAKTDSLTRPQSTIGAKQLTEKEQQMKNKVMRNAGKRRMPQEEAVETEDTAALDKEEEELVRYKSGPTTGSDANETQAATPSTSEPNSIAVSATDSRSSIGANKKRKVSAQDELLEKLREEAARKKAKNLKVKLKQQRKKEEKRLQQQQSA